MVSEIGHHRSALTLAESQILAAAKTLAKCEPDTKVGRKALRELKIARENKERAINRLAELGVTVHGTQSRR